MKAVKFPVLIALCLMIPLSALTEGMTALTFDDFTCYIWNDWYYLRTKQLTNSTAVTYTKNRNSRLDDTLVIQYWTVDSTDTLYHQGKINESLARSTGSSLCKTLFSFKLFDLNGVESAMAIGSHLTNNHNYSVVCITMKDHTVAVLRLSLSTDSMDEAEARMMEILGITENKSSSKDAYAREDLPGCNDSRQRTACHRGGLFPINPSRQGL